MPRALRFVGLIFIASALVLSPAIVSLFAVGAATPNQPFATTLANPLAIQVYDASPVYDGVLHSVSAHTIDAALLVSHDVSQDPQGSVVTARGPLSVELRLSVAANTGTGTVRHYTTTTNAGGISETGQIVPGSTSGKIWLTTDEYATGAEAQAKLALQNAPDGYYEIPVCRVQCPVGPSPVDPVPPWPGGGSEITTTYPIDVSDLPFNPFGGG